MFSEDVKRGLAGLLEQHRAKLLVELNEAAPDRRARHLACLAEFDQRSRDIARRLDLPCAPVVIYLPEGKRALGVPAVGKARRPPLASPVKLRLVKSEARS
jgi:hypothetical protein